MTYRTLVIAAGVWARAVGRLLGVALPVASLEHQYAVTEKRAGLPRDLPALRDPDLNFYLKPEVGGFAIGGWEPETVAVHGHDMPMDFGRELLPENLDRLQPILEAAARRIPVLVDARPEDDHQWSHSRDAGRRADPWAGAGIGKCVSGGRLYIGDRGLGWRGAGAGELDRDRAAGFRGAEPRSSPVRNN